MTIQLFFFHYIDSNTSGVPNHPIVYTRRARQPPDTECEVVQDEPRLSQPVARWCTRRDDDEDLGYDEPRPSQQPVWRYRRHQEANDEAGPSQQHTQPDSQTSLHVSEDEIEGVVDVTCISLFVLRLYTTCIIDIWHLTQWYCCMLEQYGDAMCIVELFDGLIWVL